MQARRKTQAPPSTQSCEEGLWVGRAASGGVSPRQPAGVVSPYAGHSHLPEASLGSSGRYQSWRMKQRRLCLRKRPGPEDGDQAHRTGRVNCALRMALSPVS